MGSSKQASQVGDKGGDVAATFAGVVEDTSTLFSSDASFTERLVAAGSLASEIVSPVSARDVKAGINALEAGAKNADTVRDLGRATDNAVEGTQEGGNVVYRALRADENPAEGLRARAPGSDTAVGSHVMGKRESDLISTTRDPDRALDKFNSGNGVVEIDLDKVDAPIIDASDGVGRGQVYSRTKSDSEVLIRDVGGDSAPIPPEAIRVIE